MMLRAQAINEFAPIADAFDRLFKEVGWLRETYYGHARDPSAP